MSHELIAALVMGIPAAGLIAYFLWQWWGTWSA
jgi:hypothetical protein